MEGDDTRPSRLKQMPTWLIAEVSGHAHRLVADALASANSRGYDYRLLAALQEFGAASQAAVGRRTRIDRSDVVEALNDLARRGFIERSADPTDRRCKIISITRLGIVHLHRLDRVLVGVQDDLLAPLSRTERQVLITVLTRLLMNQAAE